MSTQVTVSLTPTQDELWKLFDLETNEMIVTRAGRNFFPKLEYVVDGLDPTKLYAVMIQMELVGDSRYKFSNGQWAESGKADHQETASKMAWHADGVRTGREWMGTTINFDRLKITNDLKTNNAWMIPLHSMHKYIPIISIFEAPSNSPFIPSSSSQLVVATRIPYTEFTAVTAYQNQRVIDMKIKHNSYAKGFRKDNKENRKRRASSIVDYSTDESTSKSSSPKLHARNTPTPPEFDGINFQPSTSPTNQVQINPFLFPFTSPLAQLTPGNIPFPFFPFGFPPFAPFSVQTPFEEKIVEEDLSEIEKDGVKDIPVSGITSEMKIGCLRIKEEPTETNIDIVN